MVRLFYRTALADDYPVIPLILAVAQSNITLFGKKQLLDSVFIDHVSAVIGSGGSTAYLMDCSQLCAVGSISVGDGTSVTESHHIRQI